MAEPELNLEQLKPPVERPPFTGFLYRMLAFMLDCILLYFIFMGLDRIARPALLALNPALPWLSHLLVFLYFWLCYGPLTKGQTAAKALLNIRVVGRDGQPLSWAAAAKRALIINGVFAVPMLFNMPDYFLLVPPRFEFGLGFTLFCLGILGFTLLLMLALGTVFHPWKRGWHDLWAGSFVTGTPEPAAFRNTLDTPVEVVTARKMANFFKMTFIFWAIISAFLLFQAIRGVSGPETRKAARERLEHRTQYSTSTYEWMDISYPVARSQQSFNSWVHWERERAKSAGRTVPTTETLRQQWADESATINAGYVKRHGACSHADLNDPELRKSIERLRADAWKKNQEMVGAATTGTLQARFFRAVLFEPMALVMYNGRQLRGRAHGPANPVQGSLSFEDVLPSLPEAVDQKTTASASSEALRTHETPRP